MASPERQEGQQPLPEKPKTRFKPPRFFRGIKKPTIKIESPQPPAIFQEKSEVTFDATSKLLHGNYRKNQDRGPEQAVDPRIKSVVDRQLPRLQEVFGQKLAPKEIQDIATGAIRIDNLGRVIVDHAQLQKLLNQALEAKKLAADQAAKQARYAQAQEKQPAPETEAAAEKPLLTAQEARSVLLRESTKYPAERPANYFDAFTLTLERLVGARIVKDTAPVFEALVDMERPADLENVTRSVDALWTTKVTHLLRLSVLSQAGEVDKAATIGTLLQTLGRQQPQRLQELLGAAIAASPTGEGPVIALALAKEAYGERTLDFSETQFQGPAQLKNISPAIQDLLHFPLPKAWREGKVSDPVEEYATVPNLGDIFKLYSPEEAEKLKKVLAQGSIGEAIFQSALSQMQAVPKDKFNFDHIISSTADGKPVIDKDQMQQVIDTTTQHMQEGFDQASQENPNYSYRNLMQQSVDSAALVIMQELGYKEHPVFPEDSVSEVGLRRQLLGLWYTSFPSEITKQALDMIDQGETPSLGLLFKTAFANPESNFLRHLLGRFIDTGPEGYTIADSIARYSIGVDMPTVNPTSPISSQQAEIAQAIQKLLDFPLPRNVLDTKTIIKEGFLPDIGVMLNRLSNEQKNALEQVFVGLGTVGEILGYEASHQREQFRIPTLTTDKRTPIQNELDLLKERELEADQVASQYPSPIAKSALSEKLRITATEHGEAKIFDRVFIDNAVDQVVLLLFEGRDTFSRNPVDNLFSAQHIEYLREKLARGENRYTIETRANMLARALIENAANNS